MIIIWKEKIDCVCVKILIFDGIPVFLFLDWSHFEKSASGWVIFEEYDELILHFLTFLTVCYSCAHVIKNISPIIDLSIDNLSFIHYFDKKCRILS